MLLQPAVVLLAPPGLACDKLRQAICNAGGQVVLQAALDGVIAHDVLALSPAAIVIALTDADDLVLDTLLPAFTEADVLLLLEEADIAAAREGWDAQRWERHLAAKIQRHGNVLPPGAEEDVDTEDAPTVQDGMVATAALSEAAAAQDRAIDHFAYDDDTTVIAPLEIAASGDGSSVAVTDMLASWQSSADGDDSLDWAPPATFDTEVPAGIDDLLLFQQDEPVMAQTDSPSVSFNERPVLALDEGLPKRPPALPERQLSDVAVPSEWSLLELSDAPAMAPQKPAPVSTAQWDISGLSLMALEDEPSVADVPMGITVKAAPLAGIAVLMAGIGGPDAVRRLLAALPLGGMTGAVLVQLRLDGGRYANLVAQLARSTPLPVRLAAPGDAVEPGHIYVLDETTGVQEAGGRLCFAGLADGVSVLAHLSPKKTAVVMLSGAEVSEVPGALLLEQQGAWVAGQSGEGCYDPAAASALAVAGLPIAEPSRLAEMLIERWPKE